MARYRIDGAKIRQLRKARGWNAEKLAVEAGLTRVLIVRVEAGSGKNPMGNSIMAIADALGVPPGDLYCPVAEAS
jgi:transcriptional regulator with XRE-family HTH domain